MFALNHTPFPITDIPRIEDPNLLSSEDVLEIVNWCLPPGDVHYKYIQCILKW